MAVVAKQPGRVERTSSYGTASVCNAVVRQHATTIRCAFWRGNADQLAAFERDGLNHTLTIRRWLRARRLRSQYGSTARSHRGRCADGCGAIDGGLI